MKCPDCGTKITQIGCGCLSKKKRVLVVAGTLRIFNSIALELPDLIKMYPNIGRAITRTHHYIYGNQFERVRRWRFAEVQFWHGAHTNKDYEDFLRFQKRIEFDNQQTQQELNHDRTSTTDL